MLFLHWSSWALSHLEDLERWGVPFGVRAQVSTGTPATRRLAGHPLCVGVWDYASSPIEDVPGLHPMGQFCGAALHDWPAPGPARDLVLCASAGLPKKDWPLLVEAMALLEGTDRRLCLAVTGGFEDEYAKLLALTRELPDPPLVQLNSTRREIGALLARTAVAIYTLVPEARFSEPMSVRRIDEGAWMSCPTARGAGVRRASRSRLPRRRAPPAHCARAVRVAPRSSASAARPAVRRDASETRYGPASWPSCARGSRTVRSRAGSRCPVDVRPI